MVKTSISLPEDVYEEAKKSSDNLSLFVAEALREHLKRVHVQKASASFGKWEDREGESAEIVNDLRRDVGRGYAKRPR